MDTSISVSLSDSMKDWIDQQVTTGGFGDASEFIGVVLQSERERRLREQIDAKLLAVIESPMTPLTDVDWSDIRREAVARREYSRDT